MDEYEAEKLPNYSNFIDLDFGLKIKNNLNPKKELIT